MRQSILFLTLLITSCNQDEQGNIRSDENQVLIEALIQEAKNQRSIDPTQIITYADSAAELAESSDLSLLHGKALYEKAIGFFYISLYTDAKELCDEVVSLEYDILESDSAAYFGLMGSVLNLEGVMSQRQGKYDEANDYLLRALTNFEKSDNVDLVGTTYINISENF